MRTKAGRVIIRDVELKTGLILTCLSERRAAIESDNPGVRIIRLKFPVEQVKYMDRGCIHKVQTIAAAYGFEIEWEEMTSCKK